ncbi:MAG: hypothetical protein P4L69_18385 [Desulfosporosinus sp.]|nr:hypothetical protein [Desulfosporosinus sp.]
MDRWDYEEFLNTEIRKIEDLKAKGFMAKEILDLNEFSYEAIRLCGLPHYMIHNFKNLFSPICRKLIHIAVHFLRDDGCKCIPFIKSN